MDRETVLEKIAPLTDTRIRNVEHNPRTRVVVEPDQVIFRPGSGGHSLPVTPEGARKLANYISLPWGLAANLNPQTFGAVCTQGLAGKQRYALIVKEDAVQDITPYSSTRNNLNPERVLSAIGHAIHGVDYHRALTLDNTVISLEIVGEKQAAVKRNDIIQAGARVVFSPLGTVDPLVQAFGLRLVCTNGVTSNIVFQEYQYGGGGGGDEGGNAGSDNIWQWLTRATRTAYNSIDRQVLSYQKMAQERIAAPDRASMVEGMLRQSRISGEDAHAVRAMAIENPPATTYDLLNLMTYATSHVISNAQRITQAQRAIAVFSSEDSHARVCPVCHARRN